MRTLKSPNVIGEHPGVAHLLRTSNGRLHALNTFHGDLIVLADDRDTWNDLLEAVPDAYPITPRLVDDPLEVWDGYLAYYQGFTLKGRKLYLACQPPSHASTQSIALPTA